MNVPKHLRVGFYQLANVLNCISEFHSHHIRKILYLINSC